MPSRKKTRIEHAEIVRLFSQKLRELRASRGLTQTQLAREAHVTISYIGRLEAAGAAPGIDLVERLSKALGCTVADLLPTAVSPETDAILRDRARQLFDGLLGSANRETLLMLNPLLVRLIESSH